MAAGRKALHAASRLCGLMVAARRLLGQPASQAKLKDSKRPEERVLDHEAHKTGRKRQSLMIVLNDMLCCLAYGFVAWVNSH